VAAVTAPDGDDDRDVVLPFTFEASLGRAIAAAGVNCARGEGEPGGEAPAPLLVERLLLRERDVNGGEKSRQPFRSAW
jgi:hypothetical protein